MNIQSTAARPQTAVRAQAQPAPAQEQRNEDAKPSAVDSFSSGAAKGGNYANFAIGAWNGGVSGLLVGATIGGAANLIGDIAGVIKGDVALSLGSVLNSALSTGMYAAGGAVAGGVVGGVAGGLMTRGVGKVMGNIGAKTAEKFGGNPNVGRAIGTVGTGVALGTIVGAGIAGWNGAAIALGAGAIGGGLAFINS